MCDRIRVLTAALILVLTAPVSAQTPVDRKAQLRAEIDSLQPLIDQSLRVIEARDSAERARKLAELGGDVDTVAVGPFKVVGRKAGVAAVARTFEAAWADRERMAGSAAQVLSVVVFLVEDRAPIQIFTELAKRPYHYEVYLPAWRDRAINQRFAADAIGSALTARLPGDLRTWMGGAVIGGRVKPVDVYRELAVAPSSAARACFKGEGARCIDALALADPGAAWSRWYSADQLRALALPRAARDPRFSSEDFMQREVAKVNAHPCFAQKNDAACTELFGPLGPRAPLSGYVRASFVDHLITNGGPEAFAQLALDSVSPIPDRLARLANGNLAAAATAWRADIEAGKPKAVNASFGTGIATILWMLVFIGLATRSTRWRVR